MRFSVLVGTIVIGLCSTYSVSAQDKLTIDQEFAQFQKNNPQNAIVFLDAALMGQNGEASCRGGMNIAVVLPTGKAKSITVRRGFISQDYGAIVSLPAGETRIARLSCAKSQYSAPYAKIIVRSGEIINAGRLELKISSKDFNIFDPTTLGDVSVKPLSEDAVASLKERAPLTFAKAKSRLMIQTLKSGEFKQRRL